MAFDFPNSPTTGQTYSISGGPTYVYNGTAWVVLTPGNQFNRTVFTATAGQTTFTMNYVVGAIDVYRNGVKLAPADFTATNGTSIVLLNAATVGDTIEVISYPMITYSDAVKRTGDTMTGALAVPSLTVNGKDISAGPVFSATMNTSQSVSSAVYTKVNLPIVEFDTNSFFNSSTSRFQPTIAGYYIINGAVYGIGTSTITVICNLYKNGSNYQTGSFGQALSSSNGQSTVSQIVYFNGSTDYIELYGYVSATSPTFSYVSGNDGFRCRLSGYLLRAA